MQSWGLSIQPTFSSSVSLSYDQGTLSLARACIIIADRQSHAKEMEPNKENRFLWPLNALFLGSAVVDQQDATRPTLPQLFVASKSVARLFRTTNRRSSDCQALKLRKGGSGTTKKFFCARIVFTQFSAIFISQ